MVYPKESSQTVEQLSSPNVSKSRLFHGFSSDGDTRLLKAIQIKAYSQTKELQNSCSYYIQDTVHIGTKLRTRFLKQNNLMQIGDYIISVSHLHEITNRFTKDKHLLTTTDLNFYDKMNFR